MSIPRWGSSLLEGVRSPRHKFPRSIIFAVSALSLSLFVFTFSPLCSFPLLLTPQLFSLLCLTRVATSTATLDSYINTVVSTRILSSVPTSLRTLLLRATSLSDEMIQAADSPEVSSAFELRGSSSLSSLSSFLRPEDRFRGPRGSEFLDWILKYSGAAEVRANYLWCWNVERWNRVMAKQALSRQVSTSKTSAFRVRPYHVPRQHR